MIMQRWNDGRNTVIIYITTNEYSRKWSGHRIEYAKKKLKIGKSPGIDNISSEFIKEGTQLLT